MGFYRPEGTDIWIDRILYGRRDYRRILFLTCLKKRKSIFLRGSHGALVKDKSGMYYKLWIAKAQYLWGSHEFR